MKRLSEMKQELKAMAEAEAIKLWRLARRAEKHGVSSTTINAIREEGWFCNSTLTTYPERILEWDFQYKMKYAFKF